MKKITIALSTIFFLSMSFTPGILSAGEMEVHFVSEEWKNATQSDGTGLYWDIFRAIFEPEGYKVITQNKSYDGSVKMVEKKMADAMVGAYKNEIENGIYPTYHFAVDVVQAVYEKNKTLDWKGIDSIKNSTVAWIKGYSYNDYFDKTLSTTLKIRELNDRESIFGLFSAGKLDFYIDARADITDFFKAHANEYKEDDFIRQTLFELKLFVVFKNDEKGKKLASIFDKNMDKIVKNGEFRKLYDKYSYATFQFPSDL